jgi:hypothetical protein
MSHQQERDETFTLFRIPGLNCVQPKSISCRRVLPMQPIPGSQIRFQDTAVCHEPACPPKRDQHHTAVYLLTSGHSRAPHHFVLLWPNSHLQSFKHQDSSSQGKQPTALRSAARSTPGSRNGSTTCQGGHTACSQELRLLPQLLPRVSMLGMSPAVNCCSNACAPCRWTGCSPIPCHACHSCVALQDTAASTNLRFSDYGSEL